MLYYVSGDRMGFIVELIFLWVGVEQKLKLREDPSLFGSNEDAQYRRAITILNSRSTVVNDRLPAPVSQRETLP